MRKITYFFLFTVLLDCHQPGNSDDTAVVKFLATGNRKLEFDRDGNRDDLKGGTNPVEERAGSTKLEELLKTTPYLQKLGPGVRDAMEKVNKFMKKKRHASINVSIGLMKMFVAVGMIAGLTGYIVYRVGQT
uniref:Uncharacterized protein n=1 Tax=Peronospora matthiolae TaxID=2874970 RepID=A0AAV1U0E6_9STRA